LTTATEKPAGVRIVFDADAVPPAGFDVVAVVVGLELGDANTAGSIFERFVWYVYAAPTVRLRAGNNITTTTNTAIHSDARALEKRIFSSPGLPSPQRARRDGCVHYLSVYV